MNKISQFMQTMKKKGLVPKGTNAILQTMDSFKKEYNRQMPDIDFKLKFAKGDNAKRIQEFKEDMTKLYAFIIDAEERYKKKGLRNKIAMQKFLLIDTKKIMYSSMRMFKKYKNEDGDIANFNT